jgi:hypothetical protein
MSARTEIKTTEYSIIDWKYLYDFAHAYMTTNRIGVEPFCRMIGLKDNVTYYQKIELPYKHHHINANRSKQSNYINTLELIEALKQAYEKHQNGTLHCIELNTYEKLDYIREAFFGETNPAMLISELFLISENESSVTVDLYYLSGDNKHIDKEIIIAAFREKMNDDTFLKDKQLIINKFNVWVNA